MKLSRLLFKPNWQDKNAQVRRAAVAESLDAELIAALPQIAREDSDANVRLAALGRLDAYEAWRERSTGDADGRVRIAARREYIALLCSDDALRVPPLARRIAELDTLSAAETEEVASHARDRELRASALARVTRPALLAERALADPDANLRAAILERIHDAVTLERIGERARRTDKAISRRARELADGLRIGGGDAKAIAAKALALCVRADALLRSPQAHVADARTLIEREWEQLGTIIPTELQQRYGGTLALLRQLHAQAERPTLPQAPNDDAHVAPPEPPPEAIATAALLAAQASFNASLAAATQAARSERELRRMQLREIEQLAARYATSLDTGDVSAARALLAALDQSAKPLGALPATLEAHLASLRARHVELTRWQSWSNAQRRQALCVEIEALPAQGLHPDALATRVRDARDEWQRLDAAEGVSGGDNGMTRRFRGLCHRALKPTKAYFDTRAALRRGHAGEVESLLQASAALPTEIVDWKAATSLRKQLGEALRGLDAVDPRERSMLAKRLKEALAALAPRIDAHNVDIARTRARLIERAAALAQGMQTQDAAREVRDLQRQWTALGQGRRAADQRQWNEFRGHCDAVFAGIDAAQNARVAAAAAAANAAEAVLAEIDALHGDAQQPLDQAQSQLRALAARWQALPAAGRNADQRYRKVHEAASRRLHDAARALRLSRYTRALEKYALLRALETRVAPAATSAVQWASFPLADAKLAHALDARYAVAASQGGAAAVPDDASLARRRLVELEFLAGIETPTEDRELRMNFQLQRLASRMREGASATPEIELSRALLAWFGQAPQQVSLEQRFLIAARAAINALP